MATPAPASTPPPPPLPVVAVIGPTGAGKSAAAVAMALAAKAATPDLTPHIINADVTQMYPGLPIASNKPQGDDDTGGVPHHFISQLEATQEYNVRRFVRDLLKLIHDVRAVEPRPLFIICGGTHYYVQGALIEGDLSCADDEEGTTEASTASVGPSSAAVGSEGGLWHTLNAIDPVAAARWHPNDEQRIARLIALHRETGQMPSAVMEAQQRPTLRTAVTGGVAPLLVSVNCSDRLVLERRIDTRVDQMVQRGLLDEVMLYYRASDESTRNSSRRFLERAIGYKEFLPALNAAAAATAAEGDSAALDAAAADVRQAIDEMKVNTRRYALQQQQWIRNRFVGKYAALFSPHFYQVESGPQAGTAAADLMRAFLEARDGVMEAGALPKGTSRFTAADAQSTPRDLTTYRCDVCDVVLCGAAQRDSHMASNRHRGTIRRAREREAREADQARRKQPTASSDALPTAVEALDTTASH